MRTNSEPFRVGISPSPALSFLLAIVVASCGSCSTLKPGTKEDSLGPLSSITTYADARSFYVKSDKSLKDYGRFVAEPPPDVFANLTQTLSLIARASETKGLGAAELQLMNEVTRDAVRLGARSQGIVYLRDAGYRLAESYMNGAFLPIDEEKDSSKTSDEQKRESVKALRTLAPFLADVRDDPTVRAQQKEALDAALTLAANDTKLARAVVEAYWYRQALQEVLQNSKELILSELAVNPTLGSSLDGAGVASLKSRIKLDVSPDKKKVTVAFANPEMKGAYLNVKVVATDPDGKEKGRKTLLLKLDDKGAGKEDWTLPADSTHLEATAPSSFPLEIDV